MEEVTSVTIVSTNINKDILNNYNSYHIIDKSFKIEELLQYKKIIFFNVFNELDDVKIKEIYKYLDDNHILYINVTNNMEEVLATKYLIVYDKDKILIEGPTLEVLKNEKLLKRIGLNLPFIVELSLYLKDYNLLDKIYLNKESLVGDLWK